MSELYDLTSGVDDMKVATKYALQVADDLARGARFEDHHYHHWAEMESICAKLREIETLEAVEIGRPGRRQRHGSWRRNSDASAPLSRLSGLPSRVVPHNQLGGVRYYLHRDDVLAALEGE